MIDSELLSLILEGTTTRDSWPLLVERIPEYFGADLSFLVMRTPCGPDAGDVAGRTPEDPVAFDWLKTLGQTDTLNGLRRADREHATFRIDLASDSMTDAPLRDWASRNRCRSSMHGLLWQKPDSAGLLSVFRSNGTMFDEEEEARFRDLLGPLAKGVLTRQSLERARAQDAIGRSVLNTLFVGSVVLAPNRVILQTNDMARALLEEGDALCSEDGRLTTAPSAGLKIAADFTRHLEDVIKDRANFPFNATAPLLIPREGRSDLSIVSAPLAESPQRNTPTHEAAVAVSYLSVPEKFTEIAPARLRRAYGLTVTEADLAIALATGKSLRQAALDADRSEATLRKHLQSIFAKTGTHRQSELVSRLLRRIV